MATGAYRRPGPGPWRLGTRRTTDASQPQTVGIIPNFISASPQPDLLRMAGYALIAASAFDPQGASLNSQYLTGIHAQALYESQATRSLFPAVPTPPAPVSAIGSFVGNSYAPQSVDLSLKAVLTQPLVGGSALHQISAAPQYDLTQQGWVLRTAPMSQGPVPPTVLVPPVWDLTPPSVVFHPTPNVQGPVPPLVKGAPVWDLTPPSQTFKPTPNSQGPVPPLAAGAPQPVDLTLQASLSKPLVSGPASPQASNASGPQLLDLTIGAQIWKPTPNTQGPVPPLTRGSPQPDTSQLGSFTTVAATTPTLPTGPVPPYIEVAPQPDTSQLGSFAIPAAALSGVPGVSFSFSFGSHAQNLYESQATRILFKTIVPPPIVTGPVPPITSGAPVWNLTNQGWFTPAAPTPIAASPSPIKLVWAAPTWDLTNQGWFTPAVLTLQGLSSGTLLAPEAEYLDVQPWLTPASTAAQLATGPVPPFTKAAPQGVDLTLEAQLFKPAPNTQGPVPPMEWVPQQLDLTLQANLFKPTPNSQGPVVTLQWVPQQVDYTQKAWLSAPISAPPLVFGPVPPLVQNVNHPQVDGMHLGTFVVHSVPNPPIIPPQTGKLHPLGFAMLRLGGGGAV